MEARSADHHPDSETTYGRHQDARNSFTGAARRGRKSDFLLGELIARLRGDPAPDRLHALALAVLVAAVIGGDGKDFQGTLELLEQFSSEVMAKCD